MTRHDILALMGVFAATFAAALLLMGVFLPNPVRTRLARMLGGSHTDAAAGADAPGTAWTARVVRLAGPFAKLSLPEEGWDGSALRTRFMNAGMRHPSAPIVYFAAKTLLAVLFPVAAFLGMGIAGLELKANAFLAVLLVAAAFGYYLPNVVLARLIAHRKREIFEAFPNAIDLITVCVEAGLAIDAALARVADEMRLESRALSEELHLVTLELRAGSAKEKALRNLALRTGVEDIDALVAMLIQAENFGTSIADSLRVHAESLRTKRRLIAEEAAAKIALKLLFPLIFCIFPSLLLVLLGPAFIQIHTILLPRLSGGG